MANTLEYWRKKLESSEQKILRENYMQVKRHIRRLEAGNAKERTIVNHIQVLIPFSVWCKIEFKDLCEDDIFDYSEHLGRATYTQGGKTMKYSPSTLYAHKTCIKTFLKPINSTVAGVIALKKTKRELPEILTESDVEAMIKCSLNARDRALIACLYESGARKGELISVQLKHVTFDENGVVVMLPRGKTGPRRIRLIFSASYLRDWISVHPLSGDREAILFCALREPYPAISDTGLHDQLLKIAKKAGVKKPVNPHSFRHASATRLSRHLTEQELKVYLGWTPGSTMAATYVHLAGEDIDDSILKMHNIKVEDTHADSLTVGRCPRCKELNAVTALYCGKCGYLMDSAAKERIEKDASEADLLLFKIATQHPNFYETLAEEMAKIDLSKIKDK